MKKYSMILGAVLSIFALASCQKEADVETTGEKGLNKAGSIPFELVAEIDKPEATKTTLNTGTWAVDWEDGDVLYAVTTDEEWGVAYASDKDAATVAEFTYDSSTKKFSTTSTITDGEHTFNFLYTNGAQKSYHRGASTTFSLAANQTFDATTPTANLKSNDALAAQLTATTPTSFAGISMSHLFTLMKVTLKNKTGNDITATKFEITANSGTYLYGIYDVTFGSTPSVAYNKNGGNSICVNISNGAIANDGTLDVYFVMAPLSNYSGNLTLKVTDGDGNSYSKTNAVTGVTLAAGTYNTASFTCKSAAIDYVTLPWSYPSDWTDGTLSATSAELTAIEGVTANGLGSDYAAGNAPYQIKLDGTGDYINVKTNAAIGSVSLRVKMIGGGNTSSITVKESVDGSDWTDVQTLTISGSQNDIKTLTTTNGFNTASRFVQLYFTKGSNVGLGGIQISEGDATVWELSAIHVGTEPTKTSYTVGQTFDPAGMVITADYVDAGDNTHTKTDIPVTGYTYSPTGALALSDTEVTISYTEGGITKTVSQTISVSEPSGDSWVETALSDLTSSDVFVIVGNNNTAMTNDNGTSSAPATFAVTVSSGELANEPDDNIKWQVSGNATDGYTFHPNGDTSKWLYCSTTAASGSNNNMRVGTGDRKLFILNASNQLETKDSYTKRYLSIYNDQDWRCYTTAGNAPTVKFYKYTGTTGGGSTTTVATPTFTVAEGTYTSAQSVEIECTTSGATIYYTLDGTTPDDTKSMYSTALSISTTTTVKAIAIKEGVSSEVATATYTITSVGGETKTIEFTYASHSGWTISSGAEDKGSYYLLKNASYIDSPSFSFQSITSVAVTLRSFGGTQYGPLYVKYGDTTIGSQDSATKDLTNYTISVTSPSAGTGSLRFIGQNTTEANGPGISKITITYVE